MADLPEAVATASAVVLDRNARPAPGVVVACGPDEAAEPAPATRSSSVVSSSSGALGGCPSNDEVSTGTRDKRKRAVDESHVTP